jgi:CRP/FNR family transcriptional regulator, polysaccharide utilization system transcription regulator
MHALFSVEKSCLTCAVKSPLLKILSEEELQQIDDSRTSVIYRKGETIRKQGAVLTHVISIGQGMAKVFLEGPNNNNVLLSILKPTSFVGGPGMFVDQIHHFTITALTECCVCFIKMSTFREMLNTNREFNDHYLKHISQVTLAAYNRLINLTQKPIRGRLADSLLYLADDVFERREFDISVTNQELSELVGMSRDNVVRNLKKFHQEGIITKTNGIIRIDDYEALKAISIEN